MSDRCRTCGKTTESSVTIKFKPVPLCIGCGKSIMLQIAHHLAEFKDLAEDSKEDEYND
jgi:DNA-directed RNA polymerase subunit N (RpoN/RPB10)